MDSIRRNLGAGAPVYMPFRASGAAPEPVRMGILSADTATPQMEPLANMAGTYSGRRGALAPAPASSLEEPDMLPRLHSTETTARRVYHVAGSSSLDGNARIGLSQSGRLHRVA